MSKKPRVLYEDNHLLIVDKPAGWLVQGDETGDRTLTDWSRDYIKNKYNKPGDVFLHPTHRLDRPVSGVIVFAWSSKALERMNALFREDQVEKTYLAIVKERLEITGEILIHWLEKDDKKNITHVYNQPKGKAKKAELTYELIASLNKLSLLKVTPKTGRPHQIRAQLAKIGCPIQGDIKYGFTQANKDKSISLHSFEIKFIHPVKKEPIVVRSVPDWPDFKPHMNELG
tara:strand:+ start:1012 stop:1698 length:687 start_codon:yes stop_codon:yes gene_type:complete